MDRVGCEKVSQSPLTFESIFSISASALSAIDQMPIKSERSGFGWTFRIAHASPPAAATGQPISRRSKDIRGQVADTAVANAAPASTPTVSISNAILHLELEPTTLALSGQLMFDRVVCQFNSTSLGERCFDKTNFVFSSNTILGTLVYAAGDAMTITISIEIGHRADAISKSIDGRVAAALEDSLDSGDILDAKVYTYSKRCGYRKASHPRATFINSSILAKIGCEDLDAYFTTKGFGESKPTVLDLHHISSEDSVTDAYDYDSDSDLEEEDDETLPDVKLETAERMNELADDLMLTQGETNKRFLRTGRVVFFRATAYRTWATFMRFVYFNKIAYAKLKSTYIDEEAAVARFSDKTCSPKSMYRFADYFGIEKLQNSALGSIEKQLTVDNIVKELFSEFSSHHPKVIEVEVAFLKKNFSHQKVRDGLQDIALRACDGERYMAPALKRVFAEITVTPPEICLWPEKCSYNQRCGQCGSYHVYHHD